MRFLLAVVVLAVARLGHRSRCRRRDDRRQSRSRTQLRLPSFRRQARTRLLFRRRRSPVHDVPQRQVHRGHRVRLREVRPKAPTARRASTASTSSGRILHSRTRRRSGSEGVAAGGRGTAQPAGSVAAGDDAARLAQRRIRRRLQEARRVPYEDFKDRIDGIRTIVAIVEKHTEPARAAKGAARSETQGESQGKSELNAPLPDDATAGTSDAELAAIFGDGGTLAHKLAGIPFPPAAARDGAGGRARDRAARSRWSPRPAPARARRSRTSCRRCSTAARSSCRRAPRRCRTSCSSATCR